MLPLPTKPHMPGFDRPCGQPEDLRPLPCLARQHDRRREFSAHAEETGGEADVALHYLKQ